jgi:hypothetical protein
MTGIRIVLAAAASAVLALALAACGGPTAPSAPAAPAPAAPAPTDPPGASAVAAAPVSVEADKAAVQDVFRRYYQALLARDWTTACEVNAPETKEALLRNLKQQGGVTAGSCEEAFSRIYDNPAAAQIADEIAKSAQVTDVTVTGDQATITWNAQVQGQRPTVTNGLRRVDGAWRLLDTSK